MSEHSLPSTTEPKATNEPTQNGQENFNSRLEDFELEDSRPPFILSMPEVKLLGIAGVRISYFLPRICGVIPVTRH